MIKRAIVFFLITAIAIITGFFIPEQWMRPAFHYSGYYFMFLIVVVWGALLIDAVSNSFLTHFKKHSTALFFAIILMVLIFNSSPPEFKILADETNLVSVSMAMHQNKTASMPVQGFAVEYYPFEYDQQVDARPLLYPFVISIIHALLGYSPFNGFIVNFLCGTGVLFLSYLLFSQILSRDYGILAMIIMAGFPIFGFWVTSSGFEVINLFFIVFVIFSLFNFLKYKHVKYAEIVLLSLVLLAYCRYESLLFFLCLIFLTPFFLNKNTIQQYRWPVLLIPLFFLPMAWQRQINFFSPYMSGNNGLETAGHLFSVENFLTALPQNFYAISGFDPNFGFVPLIFILAMAGIYIAIKNLVLNFKAIDRSARFFYLYFSLSGCMLFAVYTSFVWGAFLIDVTNRMALPLILFLTAPAVFFLCQILHSRSRYTKNMVLFLFLIQMAYYWPVVSAHQIMERNASFYFNKQITNYLYNSYDLKKDKLLVISDRPNYFVIHGIGSISFSEAAAQHKKLSYLSNVYYDHTLVLQKCNPFNDKVLPNNSLDNRYQLQELTKLNVSSDYCINVSKVFFQ